MAGSEEDYVVLLRGINVGGKSMVAMAALREALSTAGYARVVTHLNSGNVVLGAGERDAMTLADRVEAVLLEALGRHIDVMARGHNAFTALVAANPFAGLLADGVAGKNLSVAFAREGGTLVSRLAGFDGGPFAPEALRIADNELYLYLPSGTGVSELLPAVTKAAGVPLTVRNWNTVSKLAALLASRAGSASH